MSADWDDDVPDTWDANLSPDVTASHQSLGNYEDDNVSGSRSRTTDYEEWAREKPDGAVAEEPFQIVSFKNKNKKQSKRQRLISSGSSVSLSVVPKKLTDFQFAIPSYKFYNIAFTGNRHVTRLVPFSSNIVYFDRRLGEKDTLCLHIQSYGQASTVNMVFGITTCDNKTIATHKYHSRSVCEKDGRPCGGIAMSCKLDRGVRGSNVISFRKVPEGINFLSDGFLVQQFRDSKNTFKHVAVTPFISLCGDVESVSIVELSNRPVTQTQAQSPASVPRKVQKVTAPVQSPPPALQSKVSLPSEKKASPALASFPLHQSVPAVPFKDRAFTAVPVPKPIGYERIRSPVRLPLAPTNRKWYSNADVAFKDNNIIARISADGERNYIFSNEIRCNDSFSFRVFETNSKLSEGLVIFGVTTNPILRIDLSSMPVSAHVLTSGGQMDKWFVSQNLFHAVGIFDGLKISRSAEGFSLSLDPEDDDDRQLFLKVDADAVVYPFFQIGGCVQSLKLMTREDIAPLAFRNQSRLFLTSFYLSLIRSAPSS